MAKQIKKGSISNFLLIICGFFILLPPSLNAKDIKTISSSLKKVPFLSGSFKQENFNLLQGKSTLSEGTFVFKQPSLMKWIYKKPDDLIITVGFHKIWIYDPLLENVIIQNKKAIKEIASLSFLFDPNTLAKYYTEKNPDKSLLTVENQEILYYLVPKTPDPNIKELQIAIDQGSSLLKQFVIIDQQLNYQKVTLINLNSQSMVDDNEFDFKIPEGIEIIDKSVQ